MPSGQNQFENPSQRPSPCRNGFSEETDKFTSLRNEFKVDVTFCVRKIGAQKKCHFCHELVISSKEDLDLIGDCTDIRAVGGLKIIDYNDDPSMLTKALKQVQRIDCLTIENSDSILDLKFFDSLIEITGETWNHTLPSSTLINGKVQNSVNSTVYCFTNKAVSASNHRQPAFKERIRIQNNDWIANLFPARNIQELSKNIRLEIKLDSLNCTKLKLPKEGFLRIYHTIRWRSFYVCGTHYCERKYEVYHFRVKSINPHGCPSNEFRTHKITILVCLCKPS